MWFLLIFTSVIGLAHWYLYRRLLRDPRVVGATKRYGTLGLVLLGLSIPAQLLPYSAFHDGSMLSWLAYSWLGAMFYLFLLLLAWDVVRVSAWSSRRARALLRPRPLRPSRPPADAKASDPPDAAAPPSETRRVFLARAAATSALVATGGICARGVHAARFELTRPEVEVRLARLPRALDGYSIALLSDLHIGPLLGSDFLRRVVSETNRMRPDLIAITGDVVDGSVAQIGQTVGLLSRLQARDGACFVTGNHEYYSGAEAWIAFMRRLGITVLMNERIALGDRDADGARFDLAGIPDYHAARAGGLAPDVRRAVRGRDPEHELVLLAHQPVQIHDGAAVGAGLQLSGHTHGGQVFPFGELTALVQPYLSGLHRHAGGPTQIYVSRGTGFWGPPMRVLAPAEISLVRLVRA